MYTEAGTPPVRRPRRAPTRLVESAWFNCSLVRVARGRRKAGGVWKSTRMSALALSLVFVAPAFLPVVPLRRAERSEVRPSNRVLLAYRTGSCRPLPVGRGRIRHTGKNAGATKTKTTNLILFRVSFHLPAT